jgi:hypothetical protein
VRRRGPKFVSKAFEKQCVEVGEPGGPPVVIGQVEYRFMEVAVGLKEHEVVTDGA